MGISKLLLPPTVYQYMTFILAVFLCSFYSVFYFTTLSLPGACVRQVSRFSTSFPSLTPTHRGLVPTEAMDQLKTTLCTIATSPLGQQKTYQNGTLAQRGLEIQKQSEYRSSRLRSKYLVNHLQCVGHKDRFSWLTQRKIFFTRFVIITTKTRVAPKFEKQYFVNLSLL